MIRFTVRKNTLSSTPIFTFDCRTAVNRLDRLTSGLMIIPLTIEGARLLTDEFMAGTVRKEYIARVKGRFPS